MSPCQLTWACVLLVAAADASPKTAAFQGTSGPVPAPVAERMRQYSWRQDCPVPIAELAYLRFSHYGFDGAMHEGELIVHETLATEVLEIFKALFNRHFAIEKIRLIDDYQGDDDRSMADNNTSGFNCRSVAGKPQVLSKHSYGRAIDINPVTNPMIVADTVLPPAGGKFVDRSKAAPGMLRPGDRAVREFVGRGWTWGGSWISMKDYQHFQK